MDYIYSYERGLGLIYIIFEEDIVRMKKSKRVNKMLGLVLALALTLPSWGAAMAAAADFDANQSWAAATLNQWIAKGWLSGYPDGSIKPDHQVTRGEFVALVNRAFALAGQAEIAFRDLTPDHWEYAQVAIAVKAGYISGYEDGTVRAQKDVSREEAASILAKLLKPNSTASHVSDFSDADAFSGWSRGAISAITNMKVMSGYPDGSFRPAASITRAEAVVAIDNALKAHAAGIDNRTYDMAGVFGPASGTETVRGNVTITAPGVTLQNMTIEGNLILGAGIGDGDATIRGTRVLGTTIVNGGGENSIHFVDSVLVTIEVNKQDGTVRIVAEGSTSVQTVTLLSSAKVEQDAVTGSGFAAVEVAKSLPPGSVITMVGQFDKLDIFAESVRIDLPKGSIDRLNVDKDAANASIDVGADAKVVSLVLNAVAKLLGSGKIENATLNDGAGGSSFEKLPDTMGGPQKDNTTTTTSTPPVGGGGGAAGPSSVAVRGIAVTSAGNATTVVQGNTLQLYAAVTPANASDKSILWSVAPLTNGEASIDAGGLLTAAEAGTVRVTARNAASGVTGTLDITIAAPAIQVTGASVIDASTVTFNSDVAGATVRWNGATLGAQTVIGVNTVTVPLMDDGATNLLVVEKPGYVSFSAYNLVWHDPFTYTESQLSEWTRDRTEPDSWAGDVDNWITYSTVTMPANEWYAWHGKKATTDSAATNIWKVETEFELTDSLLARDSVRTSMWLNVLDQSGANVDWSILQFKIDRDNGEKGWQYWDSAVGEWVDMAAALPVTAGVYKLAIHYMNGTVIGYIDGMEVFRYGIEADGGYTSVKEVILNSYSFGEAYEVKWKTPTVKYVAHTLSESLGIAYFTGIGFSRSETPFNHGGGGTYAAQTVLEDGSIQISATSPDNTYLDTGFVVPTGTLGELGGITVEGAGAYGLNVYFDLDGGGFFQWNPDGTLAGVGGDRYALYQGAGGSTVTIQGSSKFGLQGPLQAGEKYENTWDELRALYPPDTPVAIWIGVTKGSDEPTGTKSATIRSIAFTAPAFTVTVLSSTRSNLVDEANNTISNFGWFAVKLGSPLDLSAGSQANFAISYEYSVDGGENWEQAANVDGQVFVKDKAWTGYLNAENPIRKYPGAGYEGDIVPAYTVLASNETKVGERAYNAYQAIIAGGTVQVRVVLDITDNDGNKLETIRLDPVAFTDGVPDLRGIGVYDKVSG